MGRSPGAPARIAMTDCCIIGGGIIGLSIARELAGRGLSTRVLVRDDDRAAASWAAAGIFPPAPERPAASPADALTAWSDRLHREWARELRAETGIDNGLEECGGLHLAADSASFARLRAEADAWRSKGSRAELLAAPAVAGCEPALDGAVRRGLVAGAMLLPEERQIRPPRHLRALAASCAARGVALTHNAEVRGLLTASGRIDGVAVTTAAGAETVRAGSYVIAAGAWTAGLVAPLGLSIETRPIRGQIVLLRLPRQMLSRVVNRGLDYLVPREDGRLLVGSTLEDAGFDRTTTREAVDRLRGVARELLGDLPDVEVEQAWAGLRPGSVDGLPTIGRIPGLANAFVAAGHFRAGLHQSTGTAMLLADLVEGRSPPIDPVAFAADRVIRPGGPDSVADMLAKAAGQA